MSSSLFEPEMGNAGKGSAPTIFPPLEVKKEAEVNSLQELDVAMERAEKAQAAFAAFSEDQLEAIVKAVGRAVNRAWLLRVRLDDGGTGRATLVDTAAIAERHCHNYTGLGGKAAMRPLTIGIVPAANPTLTTVSKTLDAIRSRRALIFAPYASLAPQIVEAVSIIYHAAIGAGAPEGFLSCASLNYADLPEALHCSSRIFMQSTSEARCKPAGSHGGTDKQPISLLVLCPAS